MRETMTLNTVEDMIAQALIHTDQRFKLRDHTNYEYDDPEAGRKWSDERLSVVGKCPGYGKDGYSEWSERDDAYDKLQPSQHPVKSWSLFSDYSEFRLSPELGEKVEEVWTKKQSRYYRDQMVRTGTLTLAGILKRLGRADVAQKIREAETARKNREAIVRRNNLRQQLSRKMGELEKWVNDYGAEIGVTVEMFQLPVEIADCLKEEEVPTR